MKSFINKSIRTHLPAIATSAKQELYSHVKTDVKKKESLTDEDLEQISILIGEMIENTIIQ